MNKYIASLCLSLFFYGSLAADCKAARTPTFELLSGSWNDDRERWRTFSKQDEVDLEKFTVNYQRKAHLLFAQLPRVERIPRVMHFIWLGPRAFPEESVCNLKKWKELHPDWQMKFWTDRQERNCPIEGMEKHLIDEIHFQRLRPYLDKTKNYGEKADLIRYELLFSEGGMYIDHDVMPYRSFDTLHSSFDFFVGLENPHANEGTGTKIFPCNCLFAARSGHPILRQTIQNVVDRWEKIEKLYPGDAPTTAFNRVMNRTFHSFTLATKSCLNQEGMSDIVLPSSFFFAHKLFSEKSMQQLKYLGLLYARHDFAASWLIKKDNISTSSSHKKKKHHR